MVKSLSRALLRSSSLIILISSSVCLSSAAFANDPLEVVVTADRSEVPLKNTGSAITIITSEDIAKFGSKNIADILRTVPGLTLAEAGGLGAAAKVSLRGATAGGSMVLLDGVRIGDTSNTEGFLDFGNFSAANIERIEVLRGPQSALYGSDAMGGVINIITKKGKRTPVREVTLEGGSYGTVSARGSMSGATDKVSYAFGVNALHSDGFPRYGYRITPSPLYPLYPYLSDQTAPKPMNDPVDKAGINGNVSYRINDDVTVETGLSYYANAIQFDNSEAITPSNVYNKNNHSKAGILNGYLKSQFKAFDGALRNQLVVFGNQTKLDGWQMELDYASNPIDSDLPWYTGYVGKRLGVEYQGEWLTAPFGALMIGARREAEFAWSDQDPHPLPYTYDGVTYSYSPTDAMQTTNSVFAQKRLAISDRFDVTVGGRVDAIEEGATFPTWRTTFAYRLDETKSKLRGAVGTGAKAPSLLQRFSQYGTPDLLPEKSFGYELGIDQDLGSGITASLTAFNEDFDERIGFGTCSRTSAPRNCYYNIKNARSRGVEFETTVEVVPSAWRARFSYSYIDAIDLEKNMQIYRIPKQSASFSLTYSGIQKIEIEPRLTYVGDRLDPYFYYDPSFNYKSSDVTIPAYLRVDLNTTYKLNADNDAYVRLENLTDANTEDAFYYGSAGRSIYLGWTSRW